MGKGVVELLQRHIHKYAIRPFGVVLQAQEGRRVTFPVSHDNSLPRDEFFDILLRDCANELIYCLPIFECNNGGQSTDLHRASTTEYKSKAIVSRAKCIPCGSSQGTCLPLHPYQSLSNRLNFLPWSLAPRSASSVVG
jgi:hypothetical protein